MGSTPNAYLYAGEQVDPNLGFHYLRARYYALKHGRFVTQDPEVGVLFDPRSLHKYKYAFDDGVNSVDPSGRWTLTEAAVTAGLVGYLAAYSYTSDPWKALGFGLLTGVGVAASPVAAVGIGAAAGWSVNRLLAIGALSLPRAVALWGGGDVAKNAARSWSLSNGYVSFETSIIGRLILALPDSSGKVAAIARYSEMLAGGASGEVHAFLNWSSLSLFSYWISLESPALWANSNVSRVVVHDVLTGGISIFVRTAGGLWAML
ncbi:MAG: RHS repeat-associated core domain-containing protein [Candidatus Accumulibacter sp.]|nr:RHS repeat-associated core domain-containing protein [Accumulibacter sp.]MBN8520237.1 RHS repeat-associated core domain-containing protein [Accumulibacter sp.]MBO3713020.1 RHS repeat-associated core domain-containing protein [Accumulibacter sp.]